MRTCLRCVLESRPVLGVLFSVRWVCSLVERSGTALSGAGPCIHREDMPRCHHSLPPLDRGPEPRRGMQEADSVETVQGLRRNRLEATFPAGTWGHWSPGSHDMLVA